MLSPRPLVLLVFAFAASAGHAGPARLTGTVDIGGLRLATFTATSAKTVSPSIKVEIPAPWKIVGGGARADGGPILTASAPQTERIWFAAATLPGNALPGTVSVTVVAAQYYARHSRRWLPIPDAAYRLVATATGAARAPAGRATLPDAFVLVGGGAALHYQGAGNLLHSSWPERNGWVGGGNEHLARSPARLRVAAIGLHRGLLSYCGVQTRIGDATTPRAGSHNTQRARAGTRLIGGGARARGTGSFLVYSLPDRGTDWLAVSKDHRRVSPARLEVRAIGLVAEAWR